MCVCEREIVRKGVRGQVRKGVKEVSHQLSEAVVYR